MIELFWLLLPVAAASGWFAARYSPCATPPHAHPFSADYFKGLNYLLNEQPDKAIDVFVKLIDVDEDTIETHIALGVLFRKRGEVNRAIRIHQNLIARENLDSKQRSLAVFELAQDYLRAGLLDRAEDLFKQLAQSAHYRITAYQQLLDIYQQEQEWEKAIQIALLIGELTRATTLPVVAQFFCELAFEAKQQQRYDEALFYLKQALQHDTQCARASLLEAQIAVLQKNWQRAITALQRIEQQDIAYITEILDTLLYCYQQLEDLAGFYHYLGGLLQRHPNRLPLLVLNYWLQQDAAKLDKNDKITTMLSYLTQQPSLRGIDQLLEVALEHTGQMQREHLTQLKMISQRLLKNKPIYQCSQCGFTGKTLHWQCPSCKQWNTVKPIQGVDSE